MRTVTHIVRQNLRRVCNLAAAITLVSVGLQGQTTVIEVFDHRPLAQALEKLESVTGIAINYEDVPYENLADLEDVSTPEQRLGYPGYRLLVPRKGRIKAAVEPEAPESMTATMAGVYALLASYKAAGLPGDFTVDQANGMVYVAASKALNRAGNLRNVQPRMETAVSIPYAERTFLEGLEAITQAVTATTGTKIAIGSFPFSAARDRVTFGANGSARDALAVLLSKVSDAPASYDLLFDPLTGYMLNLRFLARTGLPSPVTVQR